MKRLVLFLSSLALISSISFKADQTSAFAEDETVTTPLFENIDRNKLNILFLEQGIRDDSGKVKSDSDGYHVNLRDPVDDNAYYKYCSDCAIIIYKDFEMMIDCGLGMRHVDSTKDDVIKKATDQVITIMESLVSSDNVWDALVFSHEDFDHIAGAANLMRYANKTSAYADAVFDIATIYDFALPDKTNKTNPEDRLNYYGGKYKPDHDDDDDSMSLLQSYIAIMKNYVSKPNHTHVAVSSYFYSYDNGAIKDKSSEGEEIITPTSDGSFKIRFFKNPITAKRNEKTIKNNTSVCLSIEYGNQKSLFTGDLEEGGISEVFEGDNQEEMHEYFADGVTFFKAGHHGSRNALTDSFINLIRPQYVMIPAVAGTAQYHHNEIQFDNMFPNANVISSFFSYTDYIYLCSYAINKETVTEKADGTQTTSIDIENYASLYGDVLFQLDGDNTEVFTSNLSNSSTHKPNKSIYETDWFKKDREPTFALYSFSDDNGDGNLNNCSLFKFGHIDILIDAGSMNGQSKDLIKNLSKRVVDKRIEYLIVTSGKKSNIAQLVGTQENNEFVGDGVLYKYKVDCIIDYGSDTKLLESDDCRIYYEKYLSLIDELNITHEEVTSKNPTKTIKVLKNTVFADKFTLNIINPCLDDCENNKTLVVSIDCFDKRFVLLSSVETYTTLLTDFVDYIKDAYVLRASQGTSKKVNSKQVLSTIGADYIFVGTTVNYNINCQFAVDKNYLLRLYNSKKDVKVYIPAYMNSKGERVDMNQDMAFTYRVRQDELTVTKIDEYKGLISSRRINKDSINAIYA